MGQFEPLPPDFPAWESRACAALLPGPRGWTLVPCLQQLPFLGFPQRLTSISHAVLAAKARVVRFEAAGALDVHSRDARLRTACLASETGSLARLAWLTSWHEFLACHQLAQADAQVWHTSGARHSLPPLPSIRTGWQGRLTKLLRANQDEHAASTHLRRRLDRWELPLLPGHRLPRAIALLAHLARVAPPRVWAAQFRLLCNGWCTARRFQQCLGCRLGCPH